MKISNADRIFSLLVRERAEWKCERCGTQYPRGKAPGLECSHHYTRSRTRIRHHPLNASAHCTKCHFHLSGRPIEFADWIYEHLGKEKASQLKALNQEDGKLSKRDRADLLLNLKASLQEMEMRRDSGETGRIEFDDPWPTYD